MLVDSRKNVILTLSTERKTDMPTDETPVTLTLPYKDWLEILTVLALAPGTTAYTNYHKMIKILSTELAK